MSRLDVTLRIPSVLRADAHGAAAVTVALEPGATLADLLDVVRRTHPRVERRLRDEQRQLRRYVNLYGDGEECRALHGVDTPLSDGSEVRVVPSVAGG